MNFASMRKSLLVNFGLGFIWWVVFFPGFFSGDSFGILSMAKSGKLENPFTISWLLYIKATTFNGVFPGIATLFDIAILIYSVTVFSFSIFEKRIAAWVSALMTATPLIGAMGITLWHDIPMTSGLVLLISSVTSIQKAQGKYSNFHYVNVTLGAILITMRPNGLPIFIVFVAILLALPHRKSMIRFSALAIAVSLGVTILANLVIAGTSPINNVYGQEVLRFDISCIASQNPDDAYVKKLLEPVGGITEWSSSNACTWFDDSPFSYDQKAKLVDSTSSIWLKLAKYRPLELLKIHIKRQDYLLPPPFYNFRTPPFIHTIIEIKDQGIAWAFPTLAETARSYPRIWNFFGGIFGYPGLWLTMIFIFVLIKKRTDYLRVAILGTILTLVLFMTAPITDARYALYILIVGQTIFVGELMLLAEKFWNKRRKASF